jgi:hypothetical protein
VHGCIRSFDSEAIMKIRAVGLELPVFLLILSMAALPQSGGGPAAGRM